MDAKEKSHATNPVGENAIENIGWTCPSRTIAVLPVRKSHTRPMASKPLGNKWITHPRKDVLALTLKQPENHRSENQWSKLPSNDLLAEEALWK
jgi:hypothetical protein